jgi:hypothetical protein
MVLLEITYAYRFRQPFFIQAFHFQPCLRISIRRPMDEVQVDVIHAQKLQALFKRLARISLPDVAVPKFCGDKDLISRYAAFPDRDTYAFFVSVGRRRIYVAVTTGEGVPYGVHRLLSVIDKVGAKADGRHRNAVVEFECSCFHNKEPRFFYYFLSGDGCRVGKRFFTQRSAAWGSLYCGGAYRALRGELDIIIDKHSMRGRNTAGNVVLGWKWSSLLFFIDVKVKQL